MSQYIATQKCETYVLSIFFLKIKMTMGQNTRKIPFCVTFECSLNVLKQVATFKL